MAPKALGVFPETTISEESKVPELGFLEMDEDEPVHRHPAKKSQAKQAMAKKVMKLLKAMMEKKEKAKTQKHEVTSFTQRLILNHTPKTVRSSDRLCCPTSPFLTLTIHTILNDFFFTHFFT